MLSQAELQKDIHIDELVDAFVRLACTPRFPAAQPGHYLLGDGDPATSTSGSPPILAAWSMCIADWRPRFTVTSLGCICRYRATATTILIFRHYAI